MASDFRIERVNIHGFRGIAEQEIDLPNGRPMHIIGGNNSGKSTVLAAVALSLNGGGFHTFRPSEYDYFHDAGNVAVREFTVSVQFSAPNEQALPHVRAAVGVPVPVCGIEVKGSTDRNGNFSHQRTLLGADGDPILLARRMPLSKGAKEEFSDRENLNYLRTYARLDELRGDVPEVMYLEPHNLREQLYTWRTGPLSRLSRMLAREFNETDWSFAYGGKDYPMPKTMERAHRVLQNAVVEFPFWKNDLKPKLQEALSLYVGRQAAITLKPDISTLEEWLTQQLIVSFASDAGGAITPLQSMGDGWQSLVRLAALDVLSQYPEEFRDHVVLLVEEPETNLHPHLRRKLRNVLERLAENGWTVITATHSPEFVSFSRTQKIVRLWRVGDVVQRADFDAAATPQEVRLQDKLDERGNHEFLFALRAIFCEGKDDVLAIRLGLAKLDIDLDALAVSFVDVGGVGSHVSYAEIAATLKIPWCAMTDQDLLANGTINPVTERARQRLSNFKTAQDLMPMWKVKLEACLGVADKTGAAMDYLRSTVEQMPLQQIEAAHPDYIGECRKIAAWLGAPQAP